MELLNRGDLADCIEKGQPNWIQVAIWERLIHDHSAINEFKQLSEKNKKNRLTIKDNDLTRYVGGSMSTKFTKKGLV